jgi:hypothetical protein
VEKNQYNLCLEILRRFNKAGILKNIILIGSWCVPFYKEYFKGTRFTPSIRTRDIDFLVPLPLKAGPKVDIPGLLEDLGFVVGFKGSKGYIKLEHPELVVEFLVPERGRGLDRPYPLPQLGLNAQALRFLDFLTRRIVVVSVDKIAVTLPHPAVFALHKLIIFQRRKNPDKIDKDKDAAVKILKALFAKDETAVVREVFDSMPRKWQAKVVSGLERADEEDILRIITSPPGDVS